MKKRSTPEGRRRRGRGAWWTISRATGLGIVAALISLLLSLASYDYQDSLLLPWLVALVIAAACGVSILWMTMLDMVTNPRRGAKVAPLRAFDIVVGLLLALPSLYLLSGQLGT